MNTSHSANDKVPQTRKIPILDSWLIPKLLGNVKIGVKLTLAFGILVVLVLVMVGLAQQSSARAISSNSQTRDLRVPAVLVATEAQTNLLRMRSSIRTHLIIGDEQSRSEYTQAQAALSDNLAQLATLYDEEALQMMLTNFDELNELAETMFALGDDLLENEPAQRILIEEADFNYTAVLGRIDEIAAAQARRPPTERHAEQLLSITDFQRSYALMVSALRRYVASGNPSFKFEYNINKLENNVAWNELVAERDFLLPHQQEDLNEIEEFQASLAPLPEEMFAIVESERTREDIYLFTTQYAPLGEQMLQNLDSIVEEQTQLLETQLAESNEQLRATQQQILLVGLLAMLAAVGLAFIFQRAIAGPIVRLTHVATRLSAGDLEARATIESKDEIGTLALAFNAMTGQLSELIQRLENQAEQLAQSNEELKVEIAVRKQAEAELREHRDHFKELVDERTAELVIAKEQAEAASQAKSAFLSNMSHELRTPLNGILGYAQILQQRPLTPDVQKGITIIHQSGQHLLTLINDILDLSKIEAGKMELTLAPIHLPSFLQNVTDIIRLRVASKNLTFHLVTPDMLPEGMLADETRLRQILLNLLGNAVKFTDAGQVVLSVTSGQSTSNTQTIRFEVEDSGSGISDEQLARIFRPFEQVGSISKQIEGTGLGLTISRQLVELMGGTLQVASMLGQGSRFWFEIDMTLADIMVGKNNIELPKQVITGYQGAPQMVLIVDDIAQNRAVIRDLLQPLNFDIVEAENGEQAIELAQKTQPDIILMDRRMPVMDGMTALQHLRQDNALQRVPVIAVSASVAEADREESHVDGFDAFLPKPIDWSDLATLLIEHLNLEWIYDKPHVSLNSESDVVEPDEIVPPPHASLVILHDLAMSGDMRGIREYIGRIKTLGAQYIPFADKLEQLTLDFEEKAILVLVEQYLKETKP